MKGLRATCITSEGILRLREGLAPPFDKSTWAVLGFNRYQIWEHDLIFQQSTRRVFWLPGKIIHHLEDEAEVKAYLYGLAPEYDDVKLDFEGEL